MVLRVLVGGHLVVVASLEEKEECRHDVVVIMVMDGNVVLGICGPAQCGCGYNLQVI
jgi:hypothetical protein